MKWWLKTDAAALRGLDGAILWLWNEFSLSRAWVMRAVGAGAIFWIAVSDNWFVAAIWLVVCLGDERGHAASDLRIRNLATAMMRSSALGIGMRAFAIGLLPLSLLEPPDTAAVLLQVLYIWLQHTLTPEDPPAPKRRLMLAMEGV